MCEPEPRPASSANQFSSETASSSKTNVSTNVNVATNGMPCTSDDSLNHSGESRGASFATDEGSVSADDLAPTASLMKPVKCRMNHEGTRQFNVARAGRGRWSISLREYMGLVTLVILSIGLVFSIRRLRHLELEVTKLRAETGYLQETEPGQIAAAKAPSDQPLTYRVRVRVPAGPAKFRVAYSSVWPSKATGPQWYGAVPLPAGESLVTIRILEDPRDKKWKIASLVSNAEGNQRMATVLPPPHVSIFRGSHDVLSTGVGRETLAVRETDSIRLLDERWLVGEGGLLLYGDRAPKTDQIGIYAELQPDVGPL